jgi:hypothetical protein
MQGCNEGDSSGISILTGAEQEIVGRTGAIHGQEIGPAGAFGRMMIEAVLKRADEAAISGDVIEILKSYREMEVCG